MGDGTYPTRRQSEERLHPRARIVACMRKLLVLLDAMARDGLRWDELTVVKKLALTTI
jgi:hypothetical protein